MKVDIVTAFLLILSGAILGGAPGIIAVYYNYTNLSKKKTIVMIGVSICVGGALFLIASGLENNLLSVICSTVPVAIIVMIGLQFILNKRKTRIDGE